MSVAAALNTAIFPGPIDHTQQEFIVYGTLTLSGNYGAANAHGDVLNLASLGIPTNSVPNRIEIFEVPTAGNAPTGYSFLYAQGTTAANGLLQVLQPQGTLNPAVEITQGGAYPAALTAATANIQFRAWFQPYV